jgi:hypothetical protein
MGCVTPIGIGSEAYWSALLRGESGVRRIESSDVTDSPVKLAEVRGFDWESELNPAGRYLASQLGDYADRPDVLVLALPRGGVPVAFEVARTLSAPLDIFLVRKLGVPGHEELAMGAIATGGVRVLPELVDGIVLNR